MVHRSRRRGITTVGMLLASLVLGLLPAIPSLAAPHPDPGVIRIQPPPGDVVPATFTNITGILYSTTSVNDVRVSVDGVDHQPELRALDGANKRFVVRADLAPGSHVVGVSFVDGEGRTARRLWRFAATDVETRRLAGADRIATAVALSRDSFPASASATAAVLATGWDFPDALSAAPIAHAVSGPLLLSAADRLSDATAAELERSLPPFATVHLMGGTAALSEQVAADVEALGFRVERLDGRSRTHTAALAATAHFDDATTVVVTASHAFADALSVAAPAARDAMPILLTSSSNLSPETEAFIEARDVTRAIVVGGSGVVRDGVLTRLRALVPNVERVAGPDRFATSLEVLDRFYDEAAAVSIANGLGFADALAGGPHAAGLDHPLLLALPTGLTSDTVQRLTDLGGPPADVYGGVDAIGSRVLQAVRRAAVNDPAGVGITEVTPRIATTVADVDAIEVGFDRGVEIAASQVLVTLDGLEWYGHVTQGDFNDRLVFVPGTPPISPDRGVDHDVDVWVLTRDGDGWHHLHWHFLLRRLEVSRGDTGEDVREVQQRLLDLGYWLPAADGTYGSHTVQAVMAFQKWERLERTGTADRDTLDRLMNAERPVPRSPRPGRWTEIDKTRQVMLFNLDGRVQWAMNTSTGTEREYTRPDGSKGVAHTPEGEFTYSRQIDGMREAELGRMWRPKYFTSSGHAIHGSTSVPSYPASHGCARLSYAGIDYVWEAGLAPIGSRILIYR